MDTGANNSSISQRAADRLKLRGQRHRYTLEVAGGYLKTYDTELCQLRVGHRNAKHNREFSNVRVRIFPRPCGSLTALDWSSLKGSWPHVDSLDIPPPVNGGAVDLLLGTDCAELFRALRADSCDEPGDPIVRHTRFGPLPMGIISGGLKMKDASVVNASFSTHMAVHREDPTLPQSLDSLSGRPEIALVACENIIVEGNGPRPSILETASQLEDRDDWDDKG